MMRHSSTPFSGRPRLCFVGHQHIREFAMPVVQEYADKADIETVDGTFRGALELARDQLRRGAVDAFVSAGSNATILRNELQAPVACVQVTGFDLMQVLIRARDIARRVGVVTYGQVIPELDAVRSLLNIDITQLAYHTPEEARHCFARLREEGLRVIVGSSLVVEYAREFQLTGLLAYSLTSIRRALDDAIELARVSRLESGRYEQLNGVLHNLQEAVLAVDKQHCITALNPPMERLLGRPRAALLGQPLDQIEPELSLLRMLEGGPEERALVQRLAQRDWVVHRTAIREYGQVVGAAIMLYDAHNIQTADSHLRMQQRRQQTGARYRISHLVGDSPSFRAALTSARRYARSDMTVLIQGETGTGKELFAQAIHNESARASRPFIAVNCASLPENLLESELFGHEEGAFTGSRRGGRRGLIEAAHSGTLFLDEVGDMPVSLQTRLLRVLQEHEITRLGSSLPVHVDIRVILATHQPLEDMVRAGRFRRDLYYRINTLRLRLPPLRERQEDLAPLAHLMIQRCADQLGVSIDIISIVTRCLPHMSRHSWPGNLRELESICSRIALLHAGRPPDHPLSQEELQQELPELFERPGPSPGTAITRIEGESSLASPTPLADRVRQAMTQSGYNRQQAARMLGVSRSTLWRWLRDMESMPS